MALKTWQRMTAAGLLMVGGGAQAALVAYQANGADLVYDDDYTPVGASSPGLTWTADANLFKTQYVADNTVVDQIIAAVPTVTDSNGDHPVVASDFNTTDWRMTWRGATAWVEWLGIIAYGGADDWRLWSALNDDGSGPCGPAYDCADSEVGHLFYDEGNLTARQNITSSITLTGIFMNVQNTGYWSGTESSASGGWYFITSDGSQSYTSKGLLNHAWAVRPGQITAPPPRCPARRG